MGSAYPKPRPRYLPPRENPALTVEYVEWMEVQYLLIRETVPCRTCDAPRGRDCVTKSGNNALKPHAARRDDWRGVLAHYAGM